MITAASRCLYPASRKQGSTPLAWLDCRYSKLVHSHLLRLTKSTVFSKCLLEAVKTSVWLCCYLECLLKKWDSLIVDTTQISFFGRFILLFNNLFSLGFLSVPSVELVLNVFPLDIRMQELSVGQPAPHKSPISFFIETKCTQHAQKEALVQLALEYQL